MRGELPNSFVNEMATLVAEELDGATELAPQMFVNKSGCGSSCVVLQRFRFDPFGAIIRCDHNVLVPRACRGRCEWVDEVEAPFLEWL